MAEPKTSSRRVEWELRREQALQLRLAGHTFEEIAEEAGYSDKGAAHKAVSTALARVGVDEAAELRDLDLARLDKLMAVVWPDAVDGDLHAIDRILRIIDRRSRILGYERRDVIEIRSTETLTATAETETDTATTVVTAETLAQMLGDNEHTRQTLARLLHEHMPAAASPQALTA